MAGSILALDLGTSLGWAILRRDGMPLISGVEDLSSRRFEGGGMRYLRFRRWLDEILKLSGPFEQIVFEEVRRHQGVDAAHVYGGLLAILSAWCEERKIAFEAVPIGTWKKGIGCKGNAGKEDVRARVRRLGFDADTFDEADAIGIALWADGRG